METHSTSRPRSLLWGALFVFSLLLAGGAGYLLHDRVETRAGTVTKVAPLSLDRVEDVWKALRKEYVSQPIDEQKAIYGAIQGLVDSLGDPYTVFFSPDESKTFQEEIGGVFEGIGAEIGMKEEQLVVIAPLPGSPAEKAGLKAGDRILAIDGMSTQGVSLDDAVRKIRGAKGTTVVLTIQRGEETANDVTIARESIAVKSVQFSMSDDKIGTITLSYFGPNTEKEFGAAVDRFLGEGGKSLIVDFRNNPGGFLDTAVDIASAFVEKGAVIVKEKFSDSEETEHKATGGNALKGIRTVALVDQGSASASEIVAGALQDYRLATLVGTKTFGKGSVQQLEEFSDGSSLKMTVAKWLTPKGRSIDEQGITPDVTIELTKEDYDNNRDPQRERALQLLREANAE